MIKNDLVLVSLNYWKDFPAYGMLCVASQLQADPEITKDYRVNLLTYGLDDNPDSIISEILSLSPEIIGFSCYLWNIKPTLELSEKIKELFPRTTIVLGGPEADFNADFFLKSFPFIDVVIHGEGEERFVEYLKASNKGGPLPDGVSFKKKDRLVLNMNREPLKDLSRLSSPYASLQRMPPRNRLFPLETLRGCPYHCRYCQIAEQYSKVRFFPLKRVEADIKAIKEWGVEYAMIIDPSFFSFPGHAFQVLDLLKFYELPFEVQLNARTLTPEQIERLFSSGLKIANLGVQTVSEKGLKACGRSWNPETMTENINLLGKRRQANISLDLMSGIPGTGSQDFWDTLDYAFTFDFNPTVYLYHLSVLTGTGFWRESGSFGLEYNPDPPYDTYAHTSCNRKEMKIVRGYALLLDGFCTNSALMNIYKMFMNFLDLSASELIRAVYPSDEVESMPKRDIPETDQLETFLECLERRFKKLEARYLNFAREYFLISRIITEFSKQKILFPVADTSKEYGEQWLVLCPTSVFQVVNYNIPDHFSGINPKHIIERPTELLIYPAGEPKVLVVSPELKEMLTLFEKVITFNQAYENFKSVGKPLDRKQFYATVKKLEMIGALIGVRGKD